MVCRMPAPSYSFLFHPSFVRVPVHHGPQDARNFLFFKSFFRCCLLSWGYPPVVMDRNGHVMQTSDRLNAISITIFLDFMACLSRVMDHHVRLKTVSITMFAFMGCPPLVMDHHGHVMQTSDCLNAVFITMCLAFMGCPPIVMDHHGHVIECTDVSCLGPL